MGNHFKLCGGTSNLRAQMHKWLGLCVIEQQLTLCLVLLKVPCLKRRLLFSSQVFSPRCPIMNISELRIRHCRCAPFTIPDPRRDANIREAEPRLRVAEHLPYRPAMSVAWLKIFQITFGNRPISSTSAVETISATFIARGVGMRVSSFGGFIHIALRKCR